MNTRLKVLVAGLVVTSSVASAMAFGVQSSSADFDLAGLNQQVQNHEARITNNEQDIKALQDNTKTAPAPNKVAVPVVTAQPVVSNTSPPAATPTPPPATQPAPYVRVYQQQTDCSGSVTYVLSWSDGSQTTTSLKPDASVPHYPSGDTTTICN